MKYKISKDFFPFNIIAPPIRNERIAGALGSLLSPPRRIFKDKDMTVTREYATSVDGASVEIIIMKPSCARGRLPALVYYHGGGFVFGASWHHYDMAKLYACECGAAVLFVNYRLAPKYKFPIPAEDCYAALRYAYDNAERLGIDPERIGVGGDSAGGALCAAASQMARDRGDKIPLFQLLIYPVTDRRMITESMRDFYDTPMWNSRLSVMMWRAYAPGEYENIAYASPAEAESFSGFSPAYIETAEFDCLRDEAREYARSLSDAGIPVELNETKATMHAFDIKKNAPISRSAIAARIAYMNKMYETGR
ncbi:MAG: alpha/beta hydrolase [Clostridia bacterium]|nr:alpha/beta hydrolase [Clostridia bacterium]